MPFILICLVQAFPALSTTVLEQSETSGRKLSPGGTIFAHGHDYAGGALGSGAYHHAGHRESVVPKLRRDHEHAQVRRTVEESKRTPQQGFERTRNRKGEELIGRQT